jgi:branched-subunit amino acid transport protein
MREILVLLVIGAGTYALRVAFLITAESRPPDRLVRLLPHVAPAVLAAIAAPALLAPQGAVAATDTLPALGATAVTWWLWLRTQQFPLALLGGLAAWWTALACLSALSRT